LVNGVEEACGDAEGCLFFSTLFAPASVEEAITAEEDEEEGNEEGTVDEVDNPDEEEDEEDEEEEPKFGVLGISGGELTTCFDLESGRGSSGEDNKLDGASVEEDDVLNPSCFTFSCGDSRSGPTDVGVTRVK
jgi:hypothetical protein